MLERLRLDGKVALVTGAGRGIGRAIALTLAEAGAAVSVTSRTRAEIEAVAAEGKERFAREMLAVTGDQTRIWEVQEVIRRTEATLGSIDVLVNNAGQPVDVPFLEMNESDAMALIDVNLMGPIRYLKAVGQGMVQRGTGKVINIASMDAFIGTPNLSVYGATKGGIAQLTKALAAEWSRNGVHVNALCPGYIRTPANEHITADEHLRDVITRRIPLRRLGEPEDLAVIAVYLASPASDFVTGATYLVDGGETAV
jgi:NAD(P)-dependent dehydrogenase (short-subunit alcohol dehydrogenase family)